MEKVNTLPIEWQPGISAPEKYPVRVYSGNLFTGDTFCSLPTSGITEEGWGIGVQMMTTGNFIPHSLDITWLSIVENKFYRGEFTLPMIQLKTYFELE